MPRRPADAPPPEPVKPITIRFPIPLYERINATLTRSEYRSFAMLVLFAVDRYVTEREREHQAGK